MDISIKCQMSLSKKLRALIQDGEASITFICTNIKDGRGDARLLISSNKLSSQYSTDFIGKETSIMLTPTAIEETTINPNMIGSLFSKQDSLKKPLGVKRTAIDKMAVTEEPEENEQSHSVKTRNEIEEEIPESFETTKNPEYRRYIQTIGELDAAIDAAKYKTSDIEIDKIQDKRKRAEAIEIKEKLEAIDVDAFIVNDKCANLAINDLGINLILNMPYNLSNISAKRLLGSTQLKAMFNAKLVKFIRPDEISKYTKQAEIAVEKPGLDVYSSPEEAEESMNRNGMKVETMPLNLNDLDEPTESEILVTSLTPRRQVSSGGTIRTTHGNNQVRSTRNTDQEQQENSKGIKTIKRTGLNY